MLLTQALAMLMTSATANGAQPVDTRPVTGAQSVLHTPDPIAPALLPYIACMYGVRGLPFLLGTNGKHISYDKTDTNCLAQRSRSKVAAMKLLEGKAVPGGGTPAAYVDSALSDVDRFVEALPARQRAGSSKVAPLGIPFMIEDEVRPAYDGYEDCLKTQVSFSQVSVNTILAVFNQAMAICRSVRDSAIIEAENALAKKGWDPAAAAKAAESTFATADQSWLEMGRQFRDSLVGRTRSGKR